MAQQTQRYEQEVFKHFRDTFRIHSKIYTSFFMKIVALTVDYLRKTASSQRLTGLYIHLCIFVICSVCEFSAKVDAVPYVLLLLSKIFEGLLKILICYDQLAFVNFVFLILIYMKLVMRIIGEFIVSKFRQATDLRNQFLIQ